MNQSALIRPDWTPATIALMVLGFVVFWPLGLAMLAYILFGERLRDFKAHPQTSGSMGHLQAFADPAAAIAPLSPPAIWPSTIGARPS